MKKNLEDLLFNTNLDLSLSTISREDPSQFSVTSRIGGPRVFLGLLFGIPCLILLFYGLRHQGIYLLLSLVFCPPLGILGLLFGLARQRKTFIPSRGQAVKSFCLFQIQREMRVQLSKDGVLQTYKRWSSGGESGGGCYFYHVEIQGLQGFGFCIAKNRQKRDDFTADLARFLGYEVIGQDGQS